MSLYGRTDSNANKTQAGLARGNGSGSVSETIDFVVFVILYPTTHLILY